jgi:RNA polymerase sigma factor (sigma-70 family)
MLTEQEAQNLIVKYIELKDKVKTSKKISNEFKKHESICVKKFSYLVTMRTNRYKKFSNYEDLNQDGFEALFHAMNNYNPSKGSFFWWAHKYISTSIYRKANLHSTIRYPLKFAKNNIPHKEYTMPLLLEEFNCPDKQMENAQLYFNLENAFKTLSCEQKNVINLAYGLEQNKPMSINKICKTLNISRVNCLKYLDSAINTMYDNIKL